MKNTMQRYGLLAMTQIFRPLKGVL